MPDVAAEKIDLTKQFPKVWKASAKKVALVEVPPLAYLMADGEGDPNGPPFQEAMEALFGLAYTLKFSSKMGGGPDWKVMGPEGLWWADDPSAFCEKRFDEWRWTLMIAQPDVVTAERVEAARETVREKKDPPALERVRLDRLEEGLSAQLLHVGPYDGVGPAVERLAAFIAEEGYTVAGRHHEIYLSDPRRVPPERLKTIVRMPVTT
jgi:hypothetical protein